MKMKCLREKERTSLADLVGKMTQKYCLVGFANDVGKKEKDGDKTWMKKNLN